MYGRSRNAKDLREILKANKPVSKFVVVKNRKPGKLKSKFEERPKKVISESDHTLTVEGGKTYHKKDVADCSVFMSNDSSQRANKKDRDIIRSISEGDKRHGHPAYGRYREISRGEGPKTKRIKESSQSKLGRSQKESRREPEIRWRQRHDVYRAKLDEHRRRRSCFSPEWQRHYDELDCPKGHLHHDRKPDCYRRNSSSSSEFQQSRSYRTIELDRNGR